MKALKKSLGITSSDQDDENDVVKAVCSSVPPLSLSLAPHPPCREPRALTLAVLLSAQVKAGPIDPRFIRELVRARASSLCARTCPPHALQRLLCDGAPYVLLHCAVDRQGAATIRAVYMPCWARARLHVPDSGCDLRHPTGAAPGAYRAGRGD